MPVVNLDEPSEDQGGAPHDPVILELRGERFTCAEKLPGIVSIELGIALDPAATQFERVRAINSFVRHVMIDDDQARFQNVLRTARPTIDLEHLVALVSKVAEAISGRPTVGQPSSPGSLPATPPTSTDDSSPVATEAGSSI